MGFLLLWAWYIIVLIQVLLNYGTAYRLTKRGSDSGVALWGWLFILNLAASIPGLCIYLWHRYKEENDGIGSKNDRPEW